MVEMSCALSRRGAATSGARHRCACTMSPSKSAGATCPSWVIAHARLASSCDLNAGSLASDALASAAKSAGPVMLAVAYAHAVFAMPCRASSAA